MEQGLMMVSGYKCIGGRKVGKGRKRIGRRVLRSWVQTSDMGDWNEGK